MQAERLNFGISKVSMVSKYGCSCVFSVSKCILGYA